MPVFIHCFICIHIEPVTEETVYEVIAEQPEQAQQEIRENTAQDPMDTISEQQSEGKPRCMS